MLSVRTRIWLGIDQLVISDPPDGATVQLTLTC